MKTFLRKIVYISLISLITCACSEEEMVSGYENVEEGTSVTLSIPYNVVAPKTISRATQEEESKLYDLTLFIFNQNGKLKGYKRIENGLAEKGAIGEIAVKTTTGASYLYALANTNTTLYSVPNLPVFNEEEAQAGNLDFTLEELKAKQFQRKKGINITDGRFVMSGTANNGALCDIIKLPDGSGAFGSISEDGKIIKLRRIVSKVNFRFGVDDKSLKSFTLKKYDIYNIPQKGYLIGHATATSAIEGNSYDDVTNLQNFSQDEKNAINIYLPENNESVAKNGTASSQADREANTYSGEQKTFTNAPNYATYIVAYGDFTKTDNSGKVVRYADVNYTIHLGDFKKGSWDNYDNERNSKYIYTVTINDVDKIVVEAKREEDGNPEPGAEGIVIDYTHGRNFLLDSHYEACVMRFKQSDIQILKRNDRGYIFQVETISGLSESFMVNSADWDENVLAGVDYQWVTFAEGGSYSEKDGMKGTPISYIETKDKTMYTVPGLLKYLYSIADDDAQWDMDHTLTFTCFVDENYYPNKKWNEYTNVNPRVLYIANNVSISTDGHSVYAEVAYGVRQRSIQTFYNRSKAEDRNFIAYGCETVDETTPTPGEYKKDKICNSDWDGRSTMINEISSEATWERSKYYTDQNYAAVVCMTRNRDLNKDGVITKDEVRWYLPSYSQYSGLWLGERSIATEAALFTGSTQDLSLSKGTYGYMHYFTNTQAKETFWGEEGSTFGTVDGYINYVRCIRNLQTENTGVEAPGTPIPTDGALSTEENTVIAEKYYYYDPNSNTFNLENMDAKALRDNPQIQEFGEHHERQNNINAPYLSFVVDTENLTENVTIENVVEGIVDCKARREATGENWRVPNQRELSLMVLEQEDLQLSRADPEGTYCKTKFSNQPYRYTYGYATNFRLYSMEGETNGYWGQSGWIRCVRDKQNNK